MVTLTEAAKRRGKLLPLATDIEVNNCFSSEIIEHKNDDFFKLILLLPTIIILARNDRTAAVVAFSCRRIKLLKAFV